MNVLLSAFACGWLLFTPPLQPIPPLRGYGAVTGAPLSEWKQERAFDSARDCEQWKEIAVKNYVPDSERPNIWLHGRCIPSDAIQFRTR